jgi:hypothetical protein
MSLSTIAAAAGVAGAVFGGHTSQFAPVGLELGPGGRTVSKLALQADFRCEDGARASWSGQASFQPFKPTTVETGENVFSPARISRSGRIRATGEAVGRYGPDAIGTLHETLRGTVRRGRAHGTYSATLTMRNEATGAPVTTCRSGTIRWAARSAPGRVYAGLTGGGQPLVIERTRDGSRVRIFYVAWTAPCPSGGAFEVGHGWTNFSISAGGHFGDQWDDEEKADDGSSDLYAFTFDGTVSGRRASGTFGVKVTRKDAAGAVTEVCDSPVTRWTARSTKGAKEVKRPKEEIRVGP